MSERRSAPSPVSCVCCLAALVAVFHLHPPRIHAACPPPPDPRGTTGILDGLVTEPGIAGQFSSIGIEQLGRFVVAWEDDLIHQIFVQRFDAGGNCICNTGDECPAALTVQQPAGLKQPLSTSRASILRRPSAGTP